MITVVLGAIGVSSQDLRHRITSETGDGFAIRAVTVDTKALIAMLTEW